MRQDSPTTYNAIGTPAAPVTLTATLADNRTTLFCRGFKCGLIEGVFTPGADNQLALILLETSNDITNGDPTNFHPLSTSVTGTTQIDVYADGGTGMSTASGIPLRIPGDGTTTNGTAVRFSNPILDLSCGYLRVSVRDSGTANFGTLSVRITFFPN